MAQEIQFFRSEALGTVNQDLKIHLLGQANIDHSNEMEYQYPQTFPEIAMHLDNQVTSNYRQKVF